MRTKTWSIRVKEWFPAQDPIATLMIKLLVLREDFVLELAGMIHGVDEEFYEVRPKSRKVEAGLDENSRAWRQLYFYRNSLRTLFEIRSEIEEFYNSSLGKAALAKESPSFRNLSAKLRKQMAKAEKTVERLRHNLGGHVSRGSIKATLRHMHEDVSGLVQVGEIYGKTRYKFVGEIVMRMLLPEVPEDHLPQKLDQLLTETGQLIPVFRTIDDLMGTCMIDRRLIR